MKIKYLFFVLSVFSIFFGVSLLLGEDIPLKVITSPNVYSLKHTELHEQFTISVLMNQNDTYHLDTQYIEKSVLTDGENHIPISIDLIQVTTEQIKVKDEAYYLVNFIVSLNIEMNDHIIQYEDAQLEITYLNEFVMDLYIGEFNYLFEENSNDVSVYNLHGTFGEVNGINTVTGIAIELYNVSNHNLVIERIDVLSEDVSTNNDYLLEKDRVIDLFEEVKDIILVDSYEFESYETTVSPQLILEGQSVKLYIPMLYNDNIKYISRFVVAVEYQIEGETKTLYIDDFIFMNQVNFGPEYENNYEVHVYEDYGL